MYTHTDTTYHHYSTPKRRHDHVVIYSNIRCELKAYSVFANAMRVVLPLWADFRVRANQLNRNVNALAARVGIFIQTRRLKIKAERQTETACS